MIIISVIYARGKRFEGLKTFRKWVIYMLSSLSYSSCKHALTHIHIHKRVQHSIFTFVASLVMVQSSGIRNMHTQVTHIGHVGTRQVKIFRTTKRFDSLWNVWVVNCAGFTLCTMSFPQGHTKPQGRKMVKFAHTHTHHHINYQRIPAENSVSSIQTRLHYTHRMRTVTTDPHIQKRRQTVGGLKSSAQHLNK